MYVCRDVGDAMWAGSRTTRHYRRVVVGQPSVLHYYCRSPRTIYTYYCVCTIKLYASPYIIIIVLISYVYAY